MSRNALSNLSFFRWPSAQLLCWLLISAGLASSASPPLAAPPAKAKVLIVEDSQATDAFLPQPERVKKMMRRGMLALTGKSTVAEAWRSVVVTNEIVGIKVYSVPGPNSGTRPAVVAALVEDMLSAGFPSNHIIIWDKHLVDLQAAGFLELGRKLGIRVESSVDAGYDDKAFYEAPLLGNPLWGDLEFARKGENVGRKSYVSKLVLTNMTKIINVVPMLNHNYAGVTGNLYGLAMGSVDNTFRFESEPDRLATAVPEIYALPALGDRVVLNVVDALIAQYEGGERGLLHYSAELNQLRFSKDPVALDVLSMRELQRLRQAAGGPAPLHTNTDLYYNASLLELGVSAPDKIEVEKIR